MMKTLLFGLTALTVLLFGCVSPADNAGFDLARRGQLPHLLAVWCPEPGTADPLAMARLFDPEAKPMDLGSGLALFEVRRSVTPANLRREGCAGECAHGGRFVLCLRPCEGASTSACRLAPVFQDGSGAMEIPTGRVAVRFSDRIDPKLRLEFERRYGLTPEYRGPSQSMLYSIPRPRNGFGALDISPELASEWYVLEAEPEWLRVRQPRKAPAFWPDTSSHKREK